MPHQSPAHALLHGVKAHHHMHHAAAAEVAPVESQLTEKHYQAEFSAFVKKYGKKYTHDEFFPRYTIFKVRR
jgi:hypothetical protein